MRVLLANSRGAGARICGGGVSVCGCCWPGASWRSHDHLGESDSCHQVSYTLERATFNAGPDGLRVANAMQFIITKMDSYVMRTDFVL